MTPKYATVSHKYIMKYTRTVILCCKHNITGGLGSDKYQNAGIYTVIVSQV